MSELFKTYERVKVERVKVATITEENVHLIAKEIGGTVDYSGDEPFLVAPGKSDHKWVLGWRVSTCGDGLMNMNGFNYAGDWKEVE